MTGRRRVVVTGLGAMTAAGEGVEAFWSACVEGRSALRPVTRFDASDWGDFPAGEIHAPLPPEEERTAALALAAAAEALRAAGLDATALPTSSGTVLGTCLGGALASFAWLEARQRGAGSGAMSAADRDGRATDAAPLPVPGGLGAPALRLASAHGLSGPVSTLSAACASGTAAIAHAAGCIAGGESDLMLAGGADALSPFVISGFWLLRALSPTLVRPFDRRRDGLALGEGAGIVVIEEMERARRRGAPILAEILGGGAGTDTHHMTRPAPNGDGVLRAMQAALADARRSRDDVEFFSAHGTGTTFNDRMETAAVKRLFGERAKQVPINSIKPIIGHTLGAAGALEAILCVKILREGVLPPTINLEEPDPDCDLDYVPGVARRLPIRCALSTSSAFAGHNAALLLGAA